MKAAILSVRRLCFLGSLFTSCLGTAIGAKAQSLTTESWKSTPPNVASVSWTSDQVNSFLNSIQSDAIPASVGDFQFVDLGNDGNLELLATIDYSGRGFYNSVAVVRKTVNGFGIQVIGSGNVSSLSKVVLDINGDGRKELLVPISLTGYSSATFPNDTWPSVYAWVQQVLVESTDQFATYERSLLPSLQMAATNLNASSPGSISAIVAQAVYDKVLRISGVDPAAGFADASGWITSQDVETRVVGAATLADIGTPAAKSALAPLLAENGTVGIYAKLAVDQALSAHAARLAIQIQPQHANNIDVSSGEPILVRIISLPGYTQPTYLDFSSLTFGQTGDEKSLRRCEIIERGDLQCMFTARVSGFSPGDAVGILKGKLKAGGQARGIGPVDVIRRSSQGNESQDK